LGFEAWGRKIELVIQPGQVPGDLVDFPLLLTKANLPEEMFDADGSFPVLSANGGEIRITSDEEGDVRLPLEVVAFVTDNDPDNGSGELHTLVPAVSGSVPTSIWIHYNKSGEVQPARDAAFGSELVWGRYDFVHHCENLLDSTANLNDLVVQDGSPTQVSGGKFGGAYSFGGGDSFTITGYDLTDNPHTRFDLSAWVKRDSEGAIASVYTQDIVLTGNYLGCLLRFDASGKIRFSFIGDDLVTATDLSSTSYMLLHGTYNAISNDRWIYKDGSEVATDNTIGTSTINPFLIGQRDGDTQYMIGDMDELRCMTGDFPSADWVGAEHASQNSPATFVIPAIADDTPPFVSNRIPAPDATGVDGNVIIKLHIEDDEAGVDTTSIQMVIDSIDAIVNGVVQAGYTGTLTDVGGGLDISIAIQKDTAFSLLQSVAISVDADDNAPNSMVTVEYSFQIGEPDSDAPRLGSISFPSEGQRTFSTLSIATSGWVDPDDRSLPLSYNFQLALDEAFSNVIKTSGWQLGNSWQVTGLELNTRHYTRVQARDAADTPNASSFSRPVSFTPVFIVDHEEIARKKILHQYREA